MNLCPKCSGPMDGDQCGVCARMAELRARLRFRSRRRNPIGGSWARAQMAQMADAQELAEASERNRLGRDCLPATDRE